MAEFYVRNSLNSEKAVKFNISLRYFVLKSSRGDHKWVLEIGTTYPDVNGDDISPSFTHTISSDNLDEAIETALAQLCSKIDWSPLVIDTNAPYIYSSNPEGNNVSIFSSVNITIKDDVPSAGIDISNMKVILNNSMTDIDITSEVLVDEYFKEVGLTWSPRIRVFSTYD